MGLTTPFFYMYYKFSKIINGKLCEYTIIMEDVCKKDCPFKRNDIGCSCITYQDLEKEAEDYFNKKAQLPK